MTTDARSDVVESVVSMPIVNPTTGRHSRSFTFFGVVDQVYRKVVVDWKSTDDPNRFITQRGIGLQAEMYALALRSAGVNIEAIEYRLIRKPTIKYCRPTIRWAVTKPKLKKAIKVLDTKEEADKEAELRGAEAEKRVQGDENRDAYEERCLQWILGDPANMVTHRHELTPTRLEQAEHLLWESTKRILGNRITNRWLANENACFTYNRPCEFLPLCEAVMNGADVDWVIQQDFEQVGEPHRELGGVDHDKDILTYSSCSLLRLCEMKYLWQIEKGLRRRSYDDGEALWIGSAMHRGLEAYSQGGLKGAWKAIDEWSKRTPIIGEDQAWKQDQDIAKARAMVRAASRKWPMGDAGAAAGLDHAP